MYQNYIKYNAETPLFVTSTENSCSPLLHYHYVSTSLTMQIPAETLSQSHRLCFIGKERDSETGFSYFGARYYDSDILTGWLSVDPLADKYPSLSPYAYCALNPIRVVDPNGDSCAVLLAGDRLGGIGHMGILVQKKNDKGEIRWFLYSKNGDDDGNLKMMFGEVQGTLDDQPGLYPDTKKEAEFESIEKFMESSFNTLKHDGEGDKYYTDYFVLPTTERQDIDIIDNMNKKLDQKYNFFFNNCSEAVVYALNKAGVKTSLIGAKGMIPAVTFFRIKFLDNLINKHQ